MLLEGSCHCQAVKFALQSEHPYPFNLCYCSICRKTAGGGGYAINLSGDSATLHVSGEAHVGTYRARVAAGNGGKPRESGSERNFCGLCGSALWVYAPAWPGLVHPFASAIDTPLPVPPARTHLMLASKASWVPVHIEPADKQFDAYPDESIAQWHARHGLVVGKRHER